MNTGTERHSSIDRYHQLFNVSEARPTAACQPITTFPSLLRKTTQQANATYLQQSVAACLSSRHLREISQLSFHRGATSSLYECRGSQTLLHGARDRRRAPRKQHTATSSRRQPRVSWAQVSWSSLGTFQCQSMESETQAFVRDARKANKRGCASAGPPSRTILATDSSNSGSRDCWNAKGGLSRPGCTNRFPRSPNTKCVHPDYAAETTETKEKRILKTARDAVSLTAILITGRCSLGGCSSADANDTYG